MEGEGRADVADSGSVEIVAYGFDWPCAGLWTVAAAGPRGPVSFVVDEPD